MGGLPTAQIDYRKNMRLPWDVLLALLPQVFSVIAGLGTSILTAHGLGPPEMGQLALVTSISSTAVWFSNPGIGQTAIRYAARAVGDRAAQLAVLRWAFRLRLLLTLVVVATFFALTPLLTEHVWQEASLTPLIWLSLPGCIAITLADIPPVYFQSQQRFGANAVVLIGQTCLGAGGMLLLAWCNSWSVQHVIITTLVTTTLGALVSLVCLPRSAMFPPGSVKELAQVRISAVWKSLGTAPALASEPDTTTPLNFALLTSLSNIIFMLMMRVDIWLMDIFLAPAQIGIYSIATRFTLPLTIILNALGMAVWTHASVPMDPPALLALLCKTFALSIQAALTGLVYAVTIPWLAPWLFGHRYAASVVPGQLLCISYCLPILTYPIGIIGFNFGLERVYWIINLLRLGLVAGLNVALLPLYGILAPPLVMIVSDMIGLTIAMALIWQRAHRGKHCASPINL